MLTYEQVKVRLENSNLLIAIKEISKIDIITTIGNQYIEKLFLISIDGIDFYLNVSYTADGSVLHSFLKEPQYKIDIKYLKKQETVELLNRAGVKENDD